MACNNIFQINTLLTQTFKAALSFFTQILVENKLGSASSAASQIYFGFYWKTNWTVLLGKSPSKCVNFKQIFKFGSQLFNSDLNYVRFWLANKLESAAEPLLGKSPVKAEI